MAWAPIKIGNGGIIPKFDIANDGTMVCATDSFGGYLWNPAQNQWIQLLTSTAMPANVVNSLLDGTTAFATGGFDDIIVDHGNSNSIWIVYHGQLYHSTDKGTTFTKVTGWPDQPIELCSDNGNGRQFTPYTAIDPANSNIIYVSTASQGLYRSTDGGTTFALVSGVASGLPVAIQKGNATLVGTDSSTTVTIGTGAKTFANNAANYGWLVYGSSAAATHYIKAVDNNNGGNTMTGYVTVINSTTSFTMNVVATTGSGTPTSWYFVNLTALGTNSVDSINPSGAVGTSVTFGHNQANFNLAAYGSNAAIATNQFLEIVQLSAPDTNALMVYVTAINSTTSFTATVIASYGSGAITDWLIYPQPRSFATPFVNGHDSTSVTIGTGTSKTFSNNKTEADVASNFGFILGQYVKVWSRSDPSRQMFGPVTTASSGSSFSITPTFSSGSGAFADWNVSQGLDSNGNRVGGGHRICFDVSGGTVAAFGQTVTKNVFVHTYGVNTFKSTDGGVTFPTTNQTTPRPNCINQMRCDPFGVLWVIDDDKTGFTNNFDKLDGVAWTSQLPTPVAGAITFSTVAIDPLNSPAKATTTITLVAGSNFTSIKSTDGGASWWQAGNVGNITAAIGPGDPAWIGTWYANNLANISGCTVAVFDPVVSGKLWMGTEGVGYFFPPVSPTVTFTFTTQTRGIEEFINNRILAPPGLGGVFVTTWDFPFFFTNNFNAYPSVIAGAAGAATPTPVRGYAIDYLWNNPNTVAVLIGEGTGFGNGTSYNNSGYSTDGGATWHQFADVSTITSGEAGGDIAVFDATHFVVLPTNSGFVPKVSSNTGAAWSPITVGGGAAPVSAWGQIANYATYCKTIEVDKANGDGYLFNINVAGSPGIGFYKSTNKGVDWTLRSQPTMTGQTNINEQLKSSGVAGCLFFTPGQQGGTFPATSLWYWTTDGCLNWNAVANFKQVITFGFGSIYPGSTFPTIYAAGWRDNGGGYVYGIWRCVNFNPATGAGTWTQVGEQFPMGVLSYPADIDGDKTVAGKVYMATNGGGQFYWTDAGPSPPGPRDDRIVGLASSEW